MKFKGDDPLDKLTKEVSVENKEESQSSHSQSPTRATSSQLTLSLSQSLYKKLVGKSQIEGVSVNELASELISEGLVLRAWEIMEKKVNMRTPQAQAQNRNQPQRGNFKNNRKGGHNNNKKQNFNHIMEDNANFLEYVRNQERNKR